jgi:hypothetical protein
MSLIRNRGLIYTAFIGVLTPLLYVDLLLYVAAYLQIPFSGFLVKELFFDPKITIFTVVILFDAVVAIIVAALVVLPLGLFGHGSIAIKVIIFIVSFVFGYFFPWDFQIEKEVVVYIFTQFNTLFLLVLSILTMYIADTKQRQA